MDGFTFGSRFYISASLQVNCAGICSVIASHFNFFFLRFLFYCKLHFIHLISLFIGLITLWSHLFGTGPERETQCSCLSSCTIWSFLFRAPGRGRRRSIGLPSCAGSRTAAPSLITEPFLLLPTFCCVSSRHSSSFPFLPVLYRILQKLW